MQQQFRRHATSHSAQHTRGGQDLLSLAIALLCAWVATGCDVTKHVPANQRLLDRVSISGDMGPYSESDLAGYVRQQPNARFLQLWRVGLGVYSLASDDTTGLSKWLKNIGSAPVIYDSTLVTNSVKQLKSALEIRGFYDAEVTDSVTKNRDKRCEVFYHVEAGEPYHISSKKYSVPAGEVGRIVIADTINSLIRVGDRFDHTVMNEERNRIARLMQENGFVNFSSECIKIWVRRDNNTRTFRDSIVVADFLKAMDNDVQPFRKAIVDSVHIVVRGTSPTATRDSIDIVDKGLSVEYRGHTTFRRRMLRRSCFVTPGETYVLSDAEQTRTRFASMDAISAAQMSFETVPDTTEATNDTPLHVVGRCELRTKKSQSFGIDLEGNNSSGNLGAAANVRYSHSNIFHGAENFTFRYRIATQNQSAANGKDHFFTFETGVEAKVTFPTMVFPHTSQHFYKRHTPKTNASASFDIQRRPEFTRTTVSTGLNYEWQGSKYGKHTLTPVELNIVSIPSISENFRQYINGSYLQYSYTDHFIMNAAYNFNYNQHRMNRNTRGWFVNFALETAGNLLNAVVPKKSDDEFKRIRNIRFAQYVKTSIDVHYNVLDFWDNQFVTRVYAGIGVPYGNSLMLPFEKSFFAGGANSLRAWPVRGLGPGRQKAAEGLRYHNQTGDIRIELNGEYRFKIFSIFEGAAFADAGNIWLLNRSHNDPEAVFTTKFLEQMALDAGLGLRLNFDFFIFRIDAAYKLYDPTNNRGWVVHERFSRSNWAWNFAIGYPF